MLTSAGSPIQVRNAILLLWASFAISTLEGVIALIVPGLSEDEIGRFLWWILAGSILILTANVYIIYCASRRRNWARIVLLVMALFLWGLVLGSHVMWPTEWGEEDWWSNATSAACAIMEVIAFYWLFTGAGARWYASKEA